MAHTRTVMFVFQVIVSSFVSAAGTPTFGGVVGCTADEDCFSGTNWRCIDGQSVGSPCTLDRGYNTTSKCICGVQDCVPLPVTKPTAGFRQYLVIGDSVSMGYFHSLAANLTANGGKWDVIHAPGNNDNTNWGQRCLRGWLGTDPHRWDIVTMNWGLHDLAFPDNEHLSVDTYSMFLRKITEQLHEMLRPDARVVWVSTTPVPTNPPPDPTTNKSCVLIPGRIEADVLRYAWNTYVGDGLC